MERNETQTILPPAPDDERSRADAHGFVGVFFDELVRAGVGHVCVSPGSRSTPLTAAAVRHPELQCFSHVDERSGGFFALGLARALRAPVALICTSGTAAANYLPAVVEAHHSAVPLVVLTADRPPELRGWDAGQTIDQLKLYGSFPRWFAEVPVPEVHERALQGARSLACRSVAEARGHGQRAAGPVHLNWPLREPLEPARGKRAQVVDALPAPGRSGAAWSLASSPPAAPSAEVVSAFTAMACRNERGLIACGPMDATDELAAAIVALGRATGWPIVADPASGLRCGVHTADAAPILASADFALRDDVFAEAHAPDVVVRFGGALVSKAFRLALERRPPHELWVVDPGGQWSDASHLASNVLACDPELLCRASARALAAEPLRRNETRWSAAWRGADRAAARAVERELASDPRLLEAQAARELARALPEGALLYVSNSMPIRLADAFLEPSPVRARVLANRGANGIDGVTSSALGAAAADAGPTVLLTGDLALLHDLGGLLAAARYPLRLVIVVLDNDGGGIFSLLPIAEHGEEVAFEEHFRTPHHLELSRVAGLFGLEYARAESLEEYRLALKQAFDAGRAGVSLVHVPIDRDESVLQYRRLAAAAAAAARASAE